MKNRPKYTGKSVGATDALSDRNEVEVQDNGDILLLRPLVVPS
jgi:hypothetical protein